MQNLGPSLAPSVEGEQQLQKFTSSGVPPHPHSLGQRLVIIDEAHRGIPDEGAYIQSVDRVFRAEDVSSMPDTVSPMNPSDRLLLTFSFFCQTQAARVSSQTHALLRARHWPDMPMNKSPRLCGEAAGWAPLRARVPSTGGRRPPIATASFEELCSPPLPGGKGHLPIDAFKAHNAN